MFDVASKRLRKFITSQEGKLSTLVLYLVTVKGFIIIAIYMVYLATLISIAFECHKKFLTINNISNEDELSYKGVYYAPLTHRICLFVVVFFEYSFGRTNYWLIYDKHDMFSLSERTQLKLLLLGILFCLPYGIMDSLEVSDYLSVLPEDRYSLVRYFHLGKIRILEKFSPFLCCLVSLSLSSLTILSNSFRYKPLLIIIYSATCVRRHLRIITNQIILANQRKEEKEAGFTGSMVTSWVQEDKQIIATLASPEKKDSGIEMGACSSASNSSLSSSRLNFGSAIERRSQIRHEEASEEEKQPKSNGGRKPTVCHLDLRAIGGTTHNHLTISSWRPNASSQTELYGPTWASEPSGRKRKYSVCIMQNLRHLETHLTRLDLFVGDIDRSNAAVVFSMTILSLIQFIYSLLFVIKLSKSIRLIAFGLAYCLGRLTMPFILLMSGNLMERESKRLLAEIESIYLQANVHSVIHSQFGSQMASLERIIKLLESIKFNCDNLLGINMSTMKSFALYTLAAIFLVVQYGKLSYLPTLTTYLALQSLSARTSKRAPPLDRKIATSLFARLAAFAN